MFKVEVKWPEAGSAIMYEDIVTWLREHIYNPHTVMTKKRNMSIEWKANGVWILHVGKLQQPVNVFAQFKNADDAVAFKLRWG